MNPPRTHHRPDPLRLGWVLVVSGSAARAQAPPECRPSRLAPIERRDLPHWTEAAEALTRELAFADRPWSCAGATVIVDLQGQGPSSVEVVLPDGLLLRRHVARAGELLPTVEAMLAVARASPTASPARGSTVDEHERPPHPAAAPELRPPPPARPGAVAFLFEGELVYRVAGSPRYSTAGVGGGAGVRSGRWGLAVRLQYEALSSAWSGSPAGFTVESWSVGLVAARFFPIGSGVLGVGPSVAIRSSTITADDGGGLTEDEIAQARLGLDLHWRTRAEGLGLRLGLRADVSAGSLFGSGRDYNPTLPAPPTWGVEATAGVSYGVRP